MPTTADKLATELGIAPEQVLQACRTAGVSTFGAHTPLDDHEAARIQAVLRVPPPQLPVMAMATPSDGLPFAEPGRRGPGGGRELPMWLVIALAVAVLGAIVGAGVLLTGSSGEDDDVRAVPTTASPTTAPATVSTLPPLVDVGHCWNDPTVPDLRGDSGNGEVLEVPCSGPHMAEVYAVVFHPAPPRSPFPGEELVRYGVDQCAIRFEGFVGRGLDDSLLNSLSLTPTERSWLLEDRSIVCSVYALDGTMLTGTVAGSRR